jgi:hypothetical protein
LKGLEKSTKYHASLSVSLDSIEVVQMMRKRAFSAVSNLYFINLSQRPAGVVSGSRAHGSAGILLQSLRGRTA